MQLPAQRLPCVAWAAGLALATALAGVACDKKSAPEGGLGLPETHGSTGPVPVLAQRCPDDQKVTAPEPGTPEAVIRDLYRALSSPEDTDEAFEAFWKHFEGMKRKEEVRAFYWKQGRKHVGKYLHPGEDVSFTICSRKTEGTRLKLFIKALDGVKTNPPITLDKDEKGQWKVDFFTP